MYNDKQKQYDFNFSVVQQLGNIKCILEDSTLEDIECELDKVLNDVQGRNKLIKIADRTTGGWTNVDEYEKSDYADDSEDDKKIRQANTQALQKKRRLQHRPSSLAISRDSNRGNLVRSLQRCRTARQFDFYFRCGLGSHFRRDCREQIPSGMSQEVPVPQFIQYPQSIL